MFLTATQVLCGKNKTRQLLNGRIRELKWANDHPTDTVGPQSFDCRLPVPGDKLICLRNDNKTGLVNGMIGSCAGWNLRIGLKEEQRAPRMNFAVEGGSTYHDLYIDHKIFTEGVASSYTPNIQQFDYGYCITVHKSQGSQFENVLLYEEWLGDPALFRKWLYTGVTRAINNLIIVGK